MAIRKYGAEPAQTETREEDNDQETLRSVKKAAQETGKESERASDGQPDRQ